MGGGAWPLLVGGLPCQVNSGNERDFSFLISEYGGDCIRSLVGPSVRR